jgi:hypothetical protein
VIQRQAGKAGGIPPPSQGIPITGPFTAGPPLRTLEATPEKIPHLPAAQRPFSLPKIPDEPKKGPRQHAAGREGEKRLWTNQRPVSVMVVRGASVSSGIVRAMSSFSRALSGPIAALLAS